MSPLSRYNFGLNKLRSGARLLLMAIVNPACEVADTYLETVLANDFVPLATVLLVIFDMTDLKRLPTTTLLFPAMGSRIKLAFAAVDSGFAT